MKHIIKKISVTGAVVLIAAVTASIAPPAAASGHATPVTMSCAPGTPAAPSTLIGLPGDTYALDNDVTGCTANGIVLDGGGYTFDLNGHEVSCVDGTAGDGWGIRIRGAAVTIIDSGNPKGVVRYCDVGIMMDASGVISGGNGGNTVDGITITKNQGDQCLTTAGEGVLIDTSSGNTIKNNTITDNGPYAGVTVLGNSADNVIDDNVVSDNAWPVKCTTATRSFYYYDTDGIRIEPHGRDNTVRNNTVEGNGLDGIALFPLTQGNVVEDNNVNANGTPVPPAATGYTFQEAREGDGIRVFRLAEANVVQENTACGNQGNGIFGGLGGNTFLDNTAGEGVGCADNDIAPDAPPRYYHDLNDNDDPPGSPDVCVNVWSGNAGLHLNKPCTEAP